MHSFVVRRIIIHKSHNTMPTIYVTLSACLKKKNTHHVIDIFFFYIYIFFTISFYTITIKDTRPYLILCFSHWLYLYAVYFIHLGGSSLRRDAQTFKKTQGHSQTSRKFLLHLLGLPRGLLQVEHARTSLQEGVL